MLFSLRADLGWLEQAVLDLDDVAGFVAQTLPAGPGRALLGELRELAARSVARTGPGRVRATLLVNLCIEGGYAAGERGVALAAYLAERGIAASRISQSGEDWIVLFDPSVVLEARRISDAEIRAAGFDLPRLADQLGS